MGTQERFDLQERLTRSATRTFFSTCERNHKGLRKAYKRAINRDVNKLHLQSAKE
jgi:hypothetical protein